MSRVCAYCGRSGNLTREHIWPAALIARQTVDLSFSKKAEKSFTGDLTTKDVCARCNNGVLSHLDAYVTELYDQFFRNPVKQREVVEFSYDFGKLVRWLLKISYNSSRATGEDAWALERYAPVIAADWPCDPAFVAVFVGTSKPAHFVNKRTGGFKRLPASGFRCAQVYLAGVDRREICLRYVSINAYSFILVITTATTISRQLSLQLRSAIYGVPLSPSGTITIPAPTWTAIDVLRGVERWPRPSAKS